MKALLFTCFVTVAAAQTTGFRAEFLRQLDDAEKKCVGLAEKMPEEKYSWRPGEGVRSIGEVYVHIAAANYLFSGFVGAKMPAGISPNMEKTVTKKAEIVDLMKRSFAFARQAVTAMPDADLEKPVKMFGNTVTERAALLVMSNHLHEHLGQSIAYARTNGVVPPWSEKP